jgi:hypothetical protein
MNLLGRFGRHRFDVHAALGARHQAHALGAAVDDHRDVKLFLDVRALLDQEAANLLPRGTCLVRDELHAEDLARLLAHFAERACDLDAAALAAAAGMDLRLDDPHLSAERFSRGDGLVDGERRYSTRGRHAEPAKDLLALVFVDFHAGSSSCGSRYQFG